jgi:hypothetical protein
VKAQGGCRGTTRVGDARASVIVWTIRADSDSAYRGRRHETL